MATKAGKNVRDRQAVTPASLRVSGQKGRPQARPAAKGAATANNKTPASTASATVSGRKAPATRPQARPTTGAPVTSVRPRSRTQTGQEPFRSTRDAMAERQRPVQAPSTGPSRPSVRPKARPQRSVSYNTWRNMTRAERREAGLPVSDMPEAAFNQAMARR